LAFLALVGWLWWNGGVKKEQPKQPAAMARPSPTNRVRSAAHVVPPPVQAIVSNAPIVTGRVETNTTPPQGPRAAFPRPAQTVLEAQIALVREGISPGSLDGGMGSQTHAALMAFQRSEGLALTGALDGATRSNLMLDDAPFTAYTVTSNDLARLQPIAPTWLGKSQQTALDFENVLELVSEKTFSHPYLIKKLNPAIEWSNVVAGTVVQVPNAAYPEAPSKAAWVTVHLASRFLEAFDADTNLIAHFPCSIARMVEKRPVGLLHVMVVAPHPNYTFDPDVFPESEEARQLKRKLILPPGPNNPVGVAWIGLDRPGYGIHGTPRPEDVGRTESHGCFRLANWNAEYLLRLVSVGTPVYVVE
jgi:lipoprotein-anchoring transpeptidase ErfK/SrfK